MFLVKKWQFLCSTQRKIITSSDWKGRKAVWVALYHPPTKLREGNVLSRACLSTGRLRLELGSAVCVCPSEPAPGGDPHVTITHDALNLTIEPPPVQGLLSFYLHLVAKTGDLLKLVHLRNRPSVVQTSRGLKKYIHVILNQIHKKSRSE